MKATIENGKCRLLKVQVHCWACCRNPEWKAKRGIAACPHGKTEENTFRLPLGDIVAGVATPIARALGMNCIDPKTKDLKPDSRCAKTKAWMNRA